MGERTNKGRALSRYLTGHTGIPFLTWNGLQSSIDAPYPYIIEVTTSRKLQHWTDHIKAMPEDRIGMSIRYDNDLPSVEQAWVGMQLRSFSALLECHYNTIRTENE